MKLNKLGAIALFIGLLFTSCSTDDDATMPVPKGDYENGLLISHEGNFGQGNASISYVSYDFNTVEHTIFNTINGQLLGDIAQSMAFNGDFAYIILNVSNKIEVVNRYTFESVATIDTGLSNPRYMAIANGKGYVTNWGDGSNATDDYVAVVNLSTNTLSGTSILVEEGPEKIIASGNSIYVAHEGGFGQNNKITVINGTTDELANIITIGDVPNSLQLDNSGNLWVLCGGKPSWTGDETGGQLFKIDTSDNSATSIDFGATEHPSFLNFDGGNLYYYLSGSVFKTDLTLSSLPNTPEISGVAFYGMRVKDAILYGLDAKDFQSNGELIVYDLSTNTETNKITLGIIPGAVYFN